MYEEFQKTGNPSLLKEVVGGLERFIAVDPGNVWALKTLMEAYLHMDNKNGIVIHLASSILSADPNDFIAHYFRGVAFRKENHDAAALKDWDVALNLPEGKHPERRAKLFVHKAGIYADSGQPETAIEFCNKALEIDSTDTQALWHKALAVLTKGDFEEGFNLYENRKTLPTWDSRKTIEAPLWDGKTKVKSLYIHGEQGVGDEVMFAAALPYVFEYLPDAHIHLELNAKVVDFVSHAELRRGLHRGGVSYSTAAPKEVTRGYDAKIPIGSLFNWSMEFGKKWLEKQVKGAYLIPSDAHVAYYRMKLEELGPPPYIALCWAGGYKATRVDSRSYNLDCYKHLMDKFTCVSGQYNTNKPLVDMQVEEFSLPKIDEESAGGDLAKQAALFKAVDLVITCQQTAVHVCGASGANCMAFIPHNPQWRYGVNGEKMAFYGDHVKLLRKPEDVSWEKFIKFKTNKLFEFYKEPVC